ncbi:hypothetical protein QF010_004697 [Pseudomonas silensiensis]
MRCLPRRSNEDYVAAAEQREAAFEAEGLAKPGDRVSRFYDCCAAGRSLALLDSCYERTSCYEIKITV